MAEKSNTYGDKSCKIPPEGYRGKAKNGRKWSIFIGLLGLLVASSCSGYYEHEATDYTLRLYYLGGSVEVRKITALDYEPYIYDYKGSYTLMYEYLGLNQIKGVVRYEVLSKSEPYIVTCSRRGVRVKGDKIMGATRDSL